MIDFHSLKVEKKVDPLLLRTWGVSEWSKKSLVAIVSWGALWGQHTLCFRPHGWPCWSQRTRFPETSYTTAGGSLRQPILFPSLQPQEWKRTGQLGSALTFHSSPSFLSNAFPLSCLSFKNTEQRLPIECPITILYLQNDTSGEGERGNRPWKRNRDGVLMGHRVDSV